MYDAFKSKLLPTGHVVISLGYAIFENSSQAGIMATPYEKSSELVESLYDIRPAIDAQKQDPIAKLFNSAAPVAKEKVSTLVGYGVAHEALHYFLSAAGYYFNLNHPIDRKLNYRHMLNLRMDMKNYGHYVDYNNFPYHLNAPGEDLRTFKYSNASKQIVPNQQLFLKTFVDSKRQFGDDDKNNVRYSLLRKNLIYKLRQKAM